MFYFYQFFERVIRTTRPVSRKKNAHSLLLLGVGILQMAIVMLSITLKLFTISFTITMVCTALLLLGAGFYWLYIEMRCITTLLTMQFMGRSGKALLTTFMLTAVATGVVQNLWLNWEETIRVFVCTTKLQVNLTKTYFDLITMPFAGQFDEAVASQDQLKAEVKKMFQFVQPAVEEVENPAPSFVPSGTANVTRPRDPRNMKAEEYTWLYKEKVQSQCVYQLRETVRVCRENYSEFHLKCINEVMFIQSYCEVFRVDQYCDISRLTNGASIEDWCDTQSLFDSEMGDVYRNLVLYRLDIYDEVKSDKLRYNISNMPIIPGLDKIQAKAKDLVDNVRSKKILIELVVVLLAYVDLFIIANLIAGTLKYYRNYVRDIDFDNIYLTNELRAIDRRRRKLKKFSILPLKHYERTVYIDPLDKELTSSDWLRISYTLVWVVFVAFIMTTLFILDWLFYTGLDVARDHALVNYTQHGSFNFTLTVKGEGLMARIIRNATTGLNFSHSIVHNESNYECLPNPVRISWFSYASVYLLWALIVYMTVNLAYTDRFKSVVCGLFFPKKHQMRVKYLYNRMLTARRIYFEENLLNVLEKVDMKAHKWKHDHAEPKQTKSKRKPVWDRITAYLRKLGSYVLGSWLLVVQPVYCTVCREEQHVPVTGVFLSCGNKRCQFRFCSSCWRNLEKKCVIHYIDHPLRYRLYEKFKETTARNELILNQM